MSDLPTRRQPTTPTPSRAKAKSHFEKVKDSDISPEDALKQAFAVLLAAATDFENISARERSKAAVELIKCYQASQGTPAVAINISDARKSPTEYVREIESQLLGDDEP